MTNYLIDFENVHEEGFAGMDKAGEQDCVFCFFTKNTPKISLSVLAENKGARFCFIEAPNGKQSLDLALASYLGYRIGCEKEKERYVIISNDTGFSKVAEFWNKTEPGRVRVCKSIQDAWTPQQGSSKQTLPQQAAKPKKAAPAPQAKAALPAEGEPSPQKDAPDAAAAEFLSAVVEKYKTEKNVKQLVYRAIVKKYGQKKGVELYKTLRKSL